MVDMLLATPGTCLYRSVGGDDWTLTQHLLALVHDQLAVANWQRSKDGAKGRNRPKPLSPILRDKRAGTRMGQTDKSPEEVKAMLRRYGPQAAPPPEPAGDPEPAELQRRVDDLALATDARTDEPGR